MIILIWLINFCISWLNAWGCGKTWNESKANGGWPHFMNWMAAIMSASGFTWCYLLIIGFFGGMIPFEREIDGKMVDAPLLTFAQIQAFADLGFMVIILPILGSGLAILIHSWGVLWRERTFGSALNAGWNTFAMGHNIYTAAIELPRASKSLSEFFGNDNDSDNGKLIIILLVIACAIAGILTTRAIIKSVAYNTAQKRSFKYASK